MIVIARVSLFYFAKYNDRAHSLVFVLLSVYRDIVILKLQTSSFFSAIHTCIQYSNRGMACSI